MKDIFQVIKRPLFTEKSTRKKEAFNELAFEVDRRANRSEVKQAVQKLFKVKVLRVNLMQMEGKKKKVENCSDERPIGRRPWLGWRPGKRLKIL